MKIILRVLIGLVGLVAVVFGVKQFATGVREISGKPAIEAPKMGETFTSAENGYSHRIPQGWQSTPGPQAGVTMIVAPKESGLFSNMVTTVEPFAGSLSEYVDAIKKAIMANAPDAKVLSDADFVTDAKVTGHKMKLQNKANHVDLAQTLYFFDAPGNRKILVTCTTPAKFATQLEPLFDDCMKTFALSAH